MNRSRRNTPTIPEIRAVKENPSPEYIAFLEEENKKRFGLTKQKEEVKKEKPDGSYIDLNISEEKL